MEPIQTSSVRQTDPLHAHPAQQTPVPQSAHARPKWPRIVGVVILILMGLFIAIVAGINIYVHTTYASFYDQAQKQFEIPGINDGFIPQDLDYLDSENVWFFSGYMNDGSPSPLYRKANVESGNATSDVTESATNSTTNGTPSNTTDGATGNDAGAITKIQLANPDGTPYTDHGSAITTTDTYAFVAAEQSYLVFDAAELAAAQEGDTVVALDRVNLDFSPAFMNIENDSLYLGVFYHPGDYETPDAMHIVTPDGTENPAVMYCYPQDETQPYGFARVPASVYSIPGMIQGTCQTETGEIVLCQSFGANSSHLYVYNQDNLVQTGTYLADGVDVALYCLDGQNLTHDVVAPPMLEGIENHLGQVFVTDESASNKYLFGKLYGAGYVYSLAL